MPANRFTALALAFVLAGCSQVFKPTVTKTEAVDDQGRHVATYTNCDPTRALEGQPTCYTERQAETNCYRTLGDVNCYPNLAVDRPVSITDSTPE